MGEFWPKSQVERELECVKARVELLRWRVEARQTLAKNEPVWIEWRHREGCKCPVCSCS